MPLFAQLFPEIEHRYPDAPKKLQFNEVLRRMLDRWVGDLIENTRAQIAAISASKAAERRETTARGVSRGSSAEDDQALAGRKNAGESARATLTVGDIRACPHRLAGLSPAIEAERLQTKEFLHRNLYFTPALEPEKEAAERIITDLFELWMAHPEKLPGNYREKAQSEPLARVVCDYIAGMTDPYIYEQYEKHCG